MAICDACDGLHECALIASICGVVEVFKHNAETRIAIAQNEDGRVLIVRLNGDGKLAWTRAG